MKKNGLFLLLILFINLCIVKVDAKSITKINAIKCGTWGDSVLVESDGKKLLMDTCLDDQKNQVLNYLKTNNVSELDLYLSHFDGDHFGKIKEILSDDSFKVGKLYLPTFQIDDEVVQEYKKIAEEKKVEIIYLKKGDKFQIGSANAEVIGPIEGAEEAVDPKNNNSLITRIMMGDISFLTTGDIQSEQEKLLLNSGINLQADILKLSHHGLDTSNTSEFIEAVSPKYSFYSFYSTEEENEFAADSRVKKVLENVMKISNVLSTEYNGNITYQIEDNQISVSAEKNFLKATIHYIELKNDNEIMKEIIPFNSNTYFHFSPRLIDGYNLIQTEDGFKIKTSGYDIYNTVDKDQDINVYYEKIAVPEKEEPAIEEQPVTNEPNIKSCFAENGKYYDKDGNETDLEGYKKSCPTVENPQTGVIIPIIIVVSLAIIDVILLYRRKKFFNLK